MKKCSNCNKRFSRGQIIKSSFLAYRDIKCSDCGAIFEHTTSNRLLIAFMTAMVILIVFLVDSYYEMGSEKFLLAGVLISLFIAAAGFLRFIKVE